MKIILVGNAVSNIEYGEKIDKFDIVVRFNDFKIKGYEKYIGTKTNIVVGFKHDNISIYDNVDMILMPTIKQDYVFDDKIKNKIKYIDIDLLEDILSYYKYPSSGFRAIQYFLKEYDDSMIYIVGFDGFKTKHYYNLNQSIWDKHDGDYEIKIINDLIQKNKLFKL